MDSWADEVLALAKRLPNDARQRLVDELQAYQPDEEPPPLSEEWKAEIGRRLQTLEDGTAVLVDGKEHFRRLRERFGDF